MRLQNSLSAIVVAGRVVLSKTNLYSLNLQQKNNVMIKNYLKSAWRSILRNRLSASINIFGLVAGLSGALVIGLYIVDELDYDQHFKNKDNIYRVISSFDKDSKTYVSAQSDAAIGPLLVQQFPEIQYSTRLMTKDEAFLFKGKTAFKEGIIYTDSGLLRVFNLDLLSGNKATCLINPSSVLISSNTAAKLFGNDWREKNVLGNLLYVDGRIPLTITGVFVDLPAHSHFTSNIFATIPAGFTSWMSDGSKIYTYVFTDGSSNAINLNKKLKSFVGNFVPGSGDHPTSFSLQRLTEIHLFSSFNDENATLGNIKNIYALMLVSVLLIIISISNFVNLYLAVSFHRLNEIGVRKVVGALSRQVRLQFLLEISVLTLIATSISIILVVICLPIINIVTGSQFAAATILHPYMIGFIAVIILMVGISAGIYPSLYLSGVKAIDALKGSRRRLSTSMSMRKVLIVLQFSVSCILIFVSIVAFRQMRFINMKSLGFDKEHIVIIANPYMLGSVEKITALKNEFLGVPGVAHVSVTGYTPSQNRWKNTKMTFPGRNEHSDYAYPASWFTVDEDYIETLGLALYEGRNFFDSPGSDKDAVIINETAAIQFGLIKNGINNAVGKELSFRETGDSAYQTYTVVGIVSDFNFGSMHEMITPVVMKKGYHRFELVLNLSDNYSSVLTLREIASIWNQHIPAIPFEYDFVKERFDLLHKSDSITSNIFSMFCVLAIILSASGLFSIVAYSITYRKREIGIRKILGASATTIAILFIEEFMKLILAAFVIALPFAWVCTHRWLEGFVYKIEISWNIYLITGLIMVAIAAFSLGLQSIKAALINPIENLRND